MKSHNVPPVLRQLFDLMLPPTCAGCDEVSEGQHVLCPTCWGKLRFITHPCCDACGHPFAYEVPGMTLCGACVRERPPFTQARAALLYNDASKDFILRFKHADRTDLATLLAKWLLQAGAEFLPAADVLVPVPLHWTRLFTRRFNQAALLALALGRMTAKPVVVDALVRHRKTPSQGHLGVTARMRNVQGAFRVAPGRRDAIKGKRVVLVDDVYTTGSTARVAAKVLLRAGAARVDLVTLARVIKDQGN
ncbi:MAG TPA: ComF family protein [Magnetovibrio sp.]